MAFVRMVGPLRGFPVPEAGNFFFRVSVSGPQALLSLQLFHRPQYPPLHRLAVKDGDLLAISIVQYQVNGQLSNRDGIFKIDGRIDERGNVQASISSSWAQAEL